MHATVLPVSTEVNVRDQPMLTSASVVQDGLEPTASQVTDGSTANALRMGGIEKLIFLRGRKTAIGLYIITP